MPATRFGYLLWLAVAFVAIATATRVVLAFALPDDASIAVSSWLRIAATGLLFDLSFFAYAAIPLVLALWLLPERVWRARAMRVVFELAFVASLSSFLAIAAAEYLFWQEFGARFNFIAVDYLVYRREVTDNIAQSYPIGWILFGVVIAAVVGYAALRRRVVRTFAVGEPFARRASIAVALLVTPCLVYAFVDDRLLDRFHNAYARELASDGPYAFVAAFRNNELDYAQFYRRIDSARAGEVVRATLGAASSDYADAEPGSLLRRVDTGNPETQRNVMLVMVESLSAKYLGHFTPGSTLTPRLDDLAGRSVFFESMYATGTRTTRGLEAVTLSVPPTPGHSIAKRIGRESGFWSLGNVLRTRGYDAEFIYGGRGYFDNMNAFFAGNGYGVIDESSVPDDAIAFKNAWGMSDEDLFRQALAAADRAHDRGQPFFFHLMTTSNHRPYTYPDGRIAIPSGTGRNGAVMYTDYAIGAFLDAAKAHPWFDDTLFVIIADHCAGSAGKDALPVANYHIPMWLYAPSFLPARSVDALTSQMDVAPTILGLLGGRYVSSAFGVDALSAAHPTRALIATYENLGYYDGRFVTVLEPRRRVERYAVDPRSGARADDGEEARASHDRDVELAIAYYQTAAEMFDARSNAWSRAVEFAAR